VIVKSITGLLLKVSDKLYNTNTFKKEENAASAGPGIVAGSPLYDYRTLYGNIYQIFEKLPDFLG